jgi:hypothetical protein
MKRKITLNDYIEINKMYFSGYLEILPDSYRNNFYPSSRFKLIIRVLRLFIRSSLLLFKYKPRLNINRKKIFFYESQNNLKILKEFDTRKNNFFYVDTKNIQHDLYYKLKYFFPILKYLISIKETHKFEIILRSAGFIEYADTLFNKCPKIGNIILANDHNPIQRALVLRAKLFNIKSFYFQHAQVSKYFPPLIFDVAFLDGQHAVDTYSKIGNTSTTLEVIGKDYSINAKKNTNIQKLGIAINPVDNMVFIESLITYLNKNHDYISVILRPHPRMKNRIILKGKYNIHNPRKYDTLNFFNQIDYMIAGDSSIHIEAILYGLSSGYFHSNNSGFFDYYGFLKHNLIDGFSDPAELLGLIKNKSSGSIEFYIKNNSINKQNEILKKYSLKKTNSKV